jgi:hypothetical protein
VDFSIVLLAGIESTSVGFGVLLSDPLFRKAANTYALVTRILVEAMVEEIKKHLERRLFIGLLAERVGFELIYWLTEPKLSR